jgi:hypothetical protein
VPSRSHLYLYKGSPWRGIVPLPREELSERFWGGSIIKDRSRESWMVRSFCRRWEPIVRIEDVGSGTDLLIGFDRVQNQR